MDEFPLSSQQEYLWEIARFLSPTECVTSRGNPFIALDIDGEVDPSRMKHALAALIERHESLRTTLSDCDLEPRQRVAVMVDPPFAYVDASAAASPDRCRQLAESLIAGHRASEFDVVSGPLWSALLVKVAVSRHILALSVSHLIIDGVSLISMVRQLTRLYAGESLPELKRQYRDFVAASRATDDRLQDKLSYWRERLLPLGSRLSYPTDYSAQPPALISFAAENLQSPYRLEKMGDLCRSAAVTPFIANVTAYAALLARPSQARRVVIGSSVAQLDLKPDEECIGYFLDMIYLAIDIRPNDTLGDLADQVQRRAFEARDNIVPYVELARALNPSFDTERPWPDVHLYDAWLRGRVFESTHSSSVATFGDTTVNLYRPTSGSPPRLVTRQEHQEAYTRYYLPSFYLNNREGTSCYLEYNQAVFKQATIRQMAKEHFSLLGCLATPGMSISEAWRAVSRAALAAEPTHTRTIIR
ncbi:condensation domain-containing protein [Streptomyces sp. NPDC006996]|uniref:condensation domain-containing protein n=1 Tax=Streptomyces sp. NPDC006996 TaxID=3156908 RepID=UPI00340040C1